MDPRPKLRFFQIRVHSRKDHAHRLDLPVASGPVYSPPHLKLNLPTRPWEDMKATCVAVGLWQDVVRHRDYDRLHRGCAHEIPTMQFWLAFAVHANGLRRRREAGQTEHP